MASGQHRKDHAEWVLTLGTDMSLGCLDQIIQSALGCIGQGAPFPGSHGNPEGGGLAFHFRAFLDALVASVGLNHLLITMEQLSCWGEVMHVCGGGLDRMDRMDEAWVLVHTDVDFHPVVPLVALLGLVHLRIPFTSIVLVPPAHSGFALVKVELGAAIKVASMFVPCFMARARSLRWAFSA